MIYNLKINGEEHQLVDVVALAVRLGRQPRKIGRYAGVNLVFGKYITIDTAFHYLVDTCINNPIGMQLADSLRKGDYETVEECNETFEGGFVKDLVEKIKARGIETSVVKVFAWLREHKYARMERGSNVPDKKSLQGKLMIMKPTNVEHLGKTMWTIYLTEKGMKFFYNEYIMNN